MDAINTNTISDYRRIRDRLRNPSNAVPDTGIDLQRPVVGVRGPWVPRARKTLPLPTPMPVWEPPPKPVWVPPVNPAPNIIGSIKRQDAPITATFSLREIRLAVCEAWGVEEWDMLAPRRHGHIITPRQVAIALCAKLTLHSYPQIGRSFKRDHTTCIHAKRKMAEHVNVVAPTMAGNATALDWALAMRARLEA